jgi:hypothetical protein
VHAVTAVGDDGDDRLEAREFDARALHFRALFGATHLLTLA